MKRKDGGRSCTNQACTRDHEVSNWNGRGSVGSGASKQPRISPVNLGLVQLANGCIVGLNSLVKVVDFGIAVHKEGQILKFVVEGCRAIGSAVCPSLEATGVGNTMWMAQEPPIALTQYWSLVSDIPLGKTPPGA